MNLINLTCNNCGADIDIDIDRLQGFCPYCGQKLLFDLDQLDKILAEKERTKQVQMQEETKRMQAAEPRRRMQAQYEYKREKEKRDNKIALRFVIGLVIFIIVEIIAFNILDAREAKRGKVESPKYAEKLLNENYEEVELMFKKAGFKNIQLKPQYDLTLENKTEEGKVFSVSIDGDTDFGTDWYEPDAEVWIRYHAIENE